MLRLPCTFLLATAATVVPATAALADPPRAESHDLNVEIEPSTSRLEVVDELTLLRGDGGTYVFALHDGLRMAGAVLDGREATKLRRRPDADPDDGLTEWEVEITPGPGPRGTLRLRYEGAIAAQVEKSEALGFVVGDDSRGVICEQGVYLSGATGWYPLGKGLARFDVEAHIPASYSVVTQGTLVERTTEPNARRRSVSRWKGKYPVDGLSLVAGKWVHETRKAGDVQLGVYLSQENAGGAKVLLDAMETYLGVYSAQLGAYAYDRFDLVENWFTTGYGMPEYTLLGKHVVARMLHEATRKGAIPPGYLDHEIVHCWWGNLVYPDYGKGNWCEGLTTYCSNYWAKERIGPEEALRHRRRQALGFTLRATPERDYPLRAFTSKREDVDNDVGYGKCSMVFHMLRGELGEPAFWDTLRRVARERAGKRLDWDGWRREFEKASGRNLAAFFTQWLDRRGAPLLRLEDVKVVARGGRLRVAGTVGQVLAAGEPAWSLSVPLVVEHLEGREELVVQVGAQRTKFVVQVPSIPLAVEVDPGYDVFRRLAAADVPPCLAATLESDAWIAVYPDGDEALEAVAKRAAQQKGGTAIAASEAPQVPARGTSLFVLGDPERVPLLASLRDTLKQHFPGAGSTPETTVLASSRRPGDPTSFVTTLVGAPEALASRSRAVFYYQHDRRIVFEGRAPKSREEALPGTSLTRVYVLPDLRLGSERERVRRTVSELSADDMQGRLAGSDGEAAARSHVIDELRLIGVDVDERPFSFAVHTLDAGRKTLTTRGAPVKGALPLVASPTTREGGLKTERLVSDPGADLKDAALLIDLPAETEDPLAFVREAAELAKTRGAKALLLRAPENPTARLAELWEFPETLHADVVKRLATARARGGNGDPLLRAAGTAARTGALVELPLPCVMVPHAWKPRPLAAPILDVGFVEHEVKSANVVARIRAPQRERPGAVVLGAHVDHLGPGFPGADDNASGVAALLEAASVLVVNQDLLGRDVLLVFFGAEEWGLRGSRAFVAALPKEHGIAAMVNADTIGNRNVEQVHVVGVSHHTRLAAVVSAALAKTGLSVGRDIDRFAFAHGSDHYPFHLAGIHAVDLWSGDYAAMHTKADTLEVVDTAKVTRIGRALALAAISIASGY